MQGIAAMISRTKNEVNICEKKENEKMEHGMEKGLLRNEKGLTLVELLAVIVILGIITAIAIPSISGLIDKTKKEAHRSNAQLIIDAARMKVTIESVGETKTYTLKDLVDGHYLEKLPEDPQNKGTTYKDTDSSVTATMASGVFSYQITLVGSTSTKYFEGTAESAIKTATLP